LRPCCAPCVSQSARRRILGCCACSDLLRGLLPAVTKETEDQKTALAKKAEAAAKGGKK
jgi:hypothetical protein